MGCRGLGLQFRSFFFGVGLGDLGGGGSFGVDCFGAFV